MTPVAGKSSENVGAFLGVGLRLMIRGGKHSEMGRIRFR